MLAQQYHRLTLNHKHVTRVVGTTFGLAWSRREARETQLQQENCETAAPLHARLRCGKRGQLTAGPVESEVAGSTCFARRSQGTGAHEGGRTRLCESGSVSCMEECLSCLRCLIPPLACQAATWSA